MKFISDFDIFVEALLTEMPHIKLGEMGENYIDLHLEDILGNVEALKKRLRDVLSEHPMAVHSLRYNPTLLLMVKKHFGLNMPDYIVLLSNITRDVFDKLPSRKMPMAPTH